MDGNPDAIKPDVVVVHLSDFHIENETSLSCQRLKSVAGAVGSLIDRPSHVIILASGDIAYSGGAEEYGAASDAFEDLIKSLEQWNPLSVRLFSCPGNHDCDFKLVNPRTREVYLKDVGDTVDDIATTIAALIPTQSEFNIFRGVVCSSCEAINDVLSTVTLAYEARTISIAMLNSAWSSAKHEIAGSLRMPALAMPDLKTTADISLAIIHHPLNWYTPEDVRGVSAWLDRNVDIVFWGHEHELDDVEHRRKNLGSSVRHYIGKAVEDRHGDCGFSVLKILGGSNSMASTTFSWRGRQPLGLDRQLALENIPINPARRLGQLRFSSNHLVFLDDPGGAFQHPRLARPLRLSEILIEPDFRCVDINESAPDDMGNSNVRDDIIQGVLTGTKTVVFGAEQSGKTTLAKSVIEAARLAGQIPVYLDAARLTSANRGEISGWVNSALASQYEEDCLVEVTSRPPSARLAIIDNLHLIPAGADGLSKVIERVSALAAKTLLLTSDSPAVAILTANQGDADVPGYWVGALIYELLPLGHKKRGDLVRKWVSIGKDGMTSSAEVENEARRTKHAIDLALGKSSIPKYAMFILILLQHMEIGRNIDTAVSGGSQGYLFEALITSALDSYSKSHPINTTHDYLAAFAHELWSRDLLRLSNIEFSQFHSSFVERSLVSVDKDLIIRDLERAKIIQADSGGIAFRYPYLFYYFIARWATSVSISESARLLDALVEHIHTEKSANILTFVAYRERQDEVLKRLLPYAKNLYDGSEMASLDHHSLLAAKFHKVEERNVLLTGRPDQVSDRHNEQQDQFERIDRSSPRERHDATSVRDVLQINTSLRTMQVLGNIMKSRASAISADDKIVVAKTVMHLSRRMMHVLFTFVDSSTEQLLQIATDAFAKELKTDRDDALDIANQFLGALVAAIAKIGIVRAAESISSAEFGPLFLRLEKELEHADDRLVVLLARIATEKFYPEDLVNAYMAPVRNSNILTRGVIRLGVAQRFYLDPPDHATLDSVCRQIGIDVKRIAPKVQGKRLPYITQSKS